MTLQAALSIEDPRVQLPAVRDAVDEILREWPANKPFPKELVRLRRIAACGCERIRRWEERDRELCESCGSRIFEAAPSYGLYWCADCFASLDEAIARLAACGVYPEELPRGRA